MTNEQISRVFELIADLQEMSGENPFKVRAFRNTAHILVSFPEDIATAHKAGKLTDIKGIGEHSAKIIADLLEHGTSPYLEELKETIPPSVLELMQVQGIGPKKAKVLFDDLHITSVDELERAVHTGRLSGLKGFGEKVTENILRGIKVYKQGRERILLVEAIPLAEELLSHLRSTGLVTAMEAAGSFRRRKETVGDIDILASTSEPDAVIGAFVNTPGTDAVLAQGPTKASILTTTGLQADLRVIPEEDYGAALLYFTGSKEHNIKLRSRAIDLGLKLNEYGLYKASSDEKVAGRTEEDMYKALGLTYIEPELREDKGEIEAALSGKLPSLIRHADIKGDLHVHSEWTDGIHPISEIVQAAADLGYSYIGISDHAEKLKVARGMGIDRLMSRLEEIEKVRKQFPQIKVLHGLEANIGSAGEIDYPPEIMELFDIVIASVHWGFGQQIDKLTERIIQACHSPYVHVIGHLTGRLIGKRDPYDIDIHQIFKACQDTGTHLELNAFPDRLDLKDDHLLIAKREYGLKFAINTDAHSKGQLEYMRCGIWNARRGWLEKEDVINTLPIDKLMKIIKKTQNK